MTIIRVDAACLIDSFSIFKSIIAPAIFCHFKFLSYKSKNGYFKINPEEVSEILNIPIIKINKFIKKFIKLGLLLKDGEYYSITNERELFNFLRNKRKEKFYTRRSLIPISDDFFYNFLRLRKSDIEFKSYFLLLLMTQHDLWVKSKQIRCTIPMNTISKTIRLWVLEDKFFDCLNNLIDLGLILVDQNHKIHTFNKFCRGAR